MIKPKIISEVFDPEKDDEDTSYAAWVGICLPDGVDIDFRADFSSRQDALKWVATMEEAMIGCEVSVGEK